MVEKQNQILSCWKETLHQKGFRVTEPRLQVMEILLSSEKALSPQEIFEISLAEDGSLGIASVYRTLEMLEELNLVQQIHQPGGCHAFWPALEGHQHLMICKKCGRMVEIPGSENIGAYIQRIEEKTGFEVEDHWLQLFGSCQHCRN